jgi:hypothetical protein
MVVATPAALSCQTDGAHLPVAAHRICPRRAGRYKKGGRLHSASSPQSIKSLPRALRSNGFTFPLNTYCPRACIASVTTACLPTATEPIILQRCATCLACRNMTMSNLMTPQTIPTSPMHCHNHVHAAAARCASSKCSRPVNGHATWQCRKGSTAHDNRPLPTYSDRKAANTLQRRPAF